MCQMLKAELKKLSFIPYLILSISGIVLLCLSATGETDMSGKQISIFSLIFQAQQANTDISKSALALWQAGIGGWLCLHRCCFPWDIFYYSLKNVETDRFVFISYVQEIGSTAFPRCVVGHWLVELYF